MTNEERTWRFETVDQADGFIGFVMKLNQGYLAIKSHRDPCTVHLNNLGAQKNASLLRMAQAWHFGWNAGQEAKKETER